MVLPAPGSMTGPPGDRAHRNPARRAHQGDRAPAGRRQRRPGRRSLLLVYEAGRLVAKRRRKRPGQVLRL